jgi:hypothetical protein
MTYLKTHHWRTILNTIQIISRRWAYLSYIYIYIYVCKLNQTVLELESSNTSSLSTALLRLLFVWHSWYKLVARGVLVFLHCTIGSDRLQCTSVNSEMPPSWFASSAHRQYSFKKRSSVENVGKGENSSSLWNLRCQYAVSSTNHKILTGYIQWIFEFIYKYIKIWLLLLRLFIWYLHYAFY